MLPEGITSIQPVYYCRTALNDSITSTVNTSDALAGKTRRVKFDGSSEWGYLYGTVSIDKRELDAVDPTNANVAISNYVLEEFNGMMSAMYHEMCNNLFLDGTGTRGVIESVSGATVTLTDRSDVLRFIENKLYICAADPSSGSPRDGGTARQVLSLDFQNRTVTFTTDVAAAGWTAGDSIIVDGMSPTHGSGDSAFKGLAAHIPSSVALPSSTFFGLDRSAIASARRSIAGQHIDKSGATAGKYTELSDAINDVVVGNHMLTKNLCLVLHPDQFQALNLDAQSFGYRDEKSNNFGHRYMEITTGATTVKCIADQYCPTNTGYLLNPDKWRVAYRNSSMIHPVEMGSDRNRLIVSGSHPAYKYNYSAVTELHCYDYNPQGRISLSAV